jgi:hypothetical protein
MENKLIVGVEKKISKYTILLLNASGG